MTTIASAAREEKWSKALATSSGPKRSRATTDVKSPASRAATSRATSIEEGPKWAEVVVTTPIMPERAVTRARATEFGRYPS